MHACRKAKNADGNAIGRRENARHRVTAECRPQSSCEVRCDRVVSRNLFGGDLQGQCLSSAVRDIISLFYWLNTPEGSEHGLRIHGTLKSDTRLRFRTLKMKLHRMPTIVRAYLDASTSLESDLLRELSPPDKIKKNNT